MSTHQPVPPVPLAMIVCDNVYHDAQGKKALVGLFDVMWTAGVPCVHPKMCVFIAMTDTHPGGQAVLEIRHCESMEPLVRMEGPIPDELQPTNILEMVIELQNVPFEREGQHLITLFVNGYPLLERPLLVRVNRPDEHV